MQKLSSFLFSHFQTSKIISMKQLIGMAVAVALGVVLATVINKQISKASTTTTA